MVSQKVITPATFTPWVEQERNRFTNPRMVGASPAAAGITGSASTLALVPGGGFVMTANVVGTGAGIRANWNMAALVIPVTPGEIVELSADATSPQSRAAALSILFYSNPTTYITGSIVTGASFTNARASVTGTAPGTAAYAAFYFATGNTTSQIGDAIFFDRIRFGAPGGTYVDGNEVGTATQRASWLGAANGSISIREVRTQLSADVTVPVYETVTIASETDSITFSGAPDATGFVYDNETLQRWYNLPKPDIDVRKRPNAHGAFDLGQVFVKEARPLLSGHFFGTSSSAGKAARRRLSGMFNDGFPVTMSVTDEEGVTTTRGVTVADYSAPYTDDFSHFTFDIELVATDPRRYGASFSMSAGMPTAGGGLFWDLGTAPSGLYFDWGTAGDPGQVSFTNTGAAATFPRIDVGGPGTITNGFRVTEIETGRELIYARSLGFGQVVSLDSRTQRATLGDSDVTGVLSSRRWFEIPRGQTRRYQVTPLGAVTGAPTITIYTAPADM